MADESDWRDVVVGVRSNDGGPKEFEARRQRSTVEVTARAPIDTDDIIDVDGDPHRVLHLERREAASGDLYRMKVRRSDVGAMGV